MAKAVIFDLDGTLIDSAVVILGIINKIRDERGYPAIFMPGLRPHLSKGGRRLVAESLGEAREDPEDDLQLFRDYYATAVQGEEIVFQDVKVLLATLKDMGFRLGICTNKPSHLCDQALVQTGLNAYFDSVITAGEALPSKPDPTAYLQCCRELEVHPRETILVGDSEVDRDTALACGAHFILVTYGYPIGAIETIEAVAKCDQPHEILHSVMRVALPAFAPAAVEPAATLELNIGE